MSRRAAGPAIRVRPAREVRRQRRRSAHPCWDHLIAAPLWPQHGANLGTLLRTCDAVGACMAVPRFSWVPEALARGNTLRRPACVHWVNDPLGWLERQRAAGSRVVGVELADEAVRLADLPAARTRTVAVLGHERSGIPGEALDLLDLAVEIPMVGGGASLNVAVAGSLVLYRLADLPAARTRTVAVLGHERPGIPGEALDLLDLAVEIPMVGGGASLNVAVAGSLVLYRLAGLL